MSKPSLSNCIGVYISLETIFIADVRSDGRSLQIERYIKIPIPLIEKSNRDTIRSSMMNAEFFINDGLWIEHVKNAMSQVKWGSNKAVVTLSPQFAVTRHFLMPRVKRRFWKQSVSIEAKKYVPFAFEKSAFDFYVYPFEGAGQERLGVLFAIMAKAASDNIERCMEKLGLELLSIEVSSLSVERLFTAMSDGGEGASRVHAHFDANTAYLVLSNNGIPVLSREVNFTDSHSSERRRLDVKGSIEFIQKQIGPNLFNTIVLSGENLDLWKMVVEEDSKLATKTWEPGKTLKIKESEWGCLAAIGSAMRFLFSASVGINLFGKSRETAEGKKALNVAWFFGVMFLVFALGFTLLQQSRLLALRKTKLKMRANTPEIVEFQGRAAEEIESLVSTMQKKSSFMGGRIDDVDRVTRKLEAIVDNIPEKAWLTNLNYRNEALSGGKSVLTQMSGSVRTGDASKDVETASKYKEDLKRNVEFAKVFSPPIGKIEITFETGGTKKQNVTLANDTGFTIKAERKQ
ncbi:MAG: pilus assembly protein PilM [Elusimicrobia bacterium]|nr:pilus assembly protein PilM [Elusimicrobiota bacterium]